VQEIKYKKENKRNKKKLTEKYKKKVHTVKHSSLLCPVTI